MKQFFVNKRLVIGIVAVVAAIYFVNWILFRAPNYKPTAIDELDYCIGEASRKLGRYDELSPEIFHCEDSWFKERAFNVTIFNGGSFPRYDTELVNIDYKGMVTITLKKTYPSPEQQTQTFQLSSDEIMGIRSAVRRANVFSLNDSYVDQQMLDVAGSKWIFMVNGKKKEIELLVPRADDLPKSLAEVTKKIGLIIANNRKPFASKME